MLSGVFVVCRLDEVLDCMFEGQKRDRCFKENILLLECRRDIYAIMLPGGIYAIMLPRGMYAIMLPSCSH